MARHDPDTLATTALRPAAWSATMRPIAFWLYVAMGIAMIIGSAIALPFLSERR